MLPDVSSGKFVSHEPQGVRTGRQDSERDRVRAFLRNAAKHWTDGRIANTIILRMSNGFAQELARLGPGRPIGEWSLARARGYCGRLARIHYENFSVAS